MLDLFGMVAQIKRPKLLIQSAKKGIKEYDREKHLAHILRITSLPQLGESLIKLIELERNCNESRIAGHSSYCFSDHVSVLIALLGEANHLHSRDII